MIYILCLESMKLTSMKCRLVLVCSFTSLWSYMRVTIGSKEIEYLHLSKVEYVRKIIKRFSDQHLADLETRIALSSKYQGIAITMPNGGGKYGVEPWKLGRKRRSEPQTVEQLFRTPEEDEGDPSGLTPLSYDELLFLAKIGVMSLRQHY
ncbi:hypothetical protein HHI36_021284 [Cryptolaemus montrouzieri]|uniref:Uncharacterized protein n=1 Tax=Cryptolaemus montrouzieri TaxID=559131 RepID=A0ABD2MWG1_9CUCU